MYCAYCTIFNTDEVKEKSFTLNGITDWSNLHNTTKRHENLGTHSNNLIAGDRFIAIKTRAQEPVTSMVSKKRKEDVKTNRDIMKEIIRVLILCGRQQIAIRGHTEERSNFMAILRALAEHHEILREHLQNPLATVKYTSPNIQNQILIICGDIVRNKIAKACNNAGYFALIGDEATDVSTYEQVAICVRFLDHEKNMPVLREEFIGFVKAENTTGETLAELFINTLEEYGIDIANMRAQGYDGAANMSGVRRGVQARVRERIPSANYVHCKAHVLNIAVVHSCADASVRTMMATVHDVAFSFHYSAKKLTTFTDELEANENAQDALD